MGTKPDDRYKALIISCYRGVSEEVLRNHKKVIEKFKPKVCTYYQAMMSYYHGTSINNVIEECFDEFDVFIILDVDCIPISRRSFPFLLDNARAGYLVGCAQRANHIKNKGHIYISPFCMAFSKELYKQLGKPSFMNTSRGDTGEELTYRCEKKKKKTKFMWPTDVIEPLWDLKGSIKFGIGTTYDRMFYHQFGAREECKKYEKEFIRRCKIVLGQK